ncbi:ricin-type beta-trefoil lectin domain protein [Kitasatospora sp. NPDC052896]|uniref:ricin-type beta-trefoil lectin domain protein n=1 Tax=Kitasatospora sp. NPDC052896 TaxID=3364061 RepID=UPI0037CB036B
MREREGVPRRRVHRLARGVATVSTLTTLLAAGLAGTAQADTGKPATPHSTTATPHGTTAAVAGDVTGDGLPDIVAATGSSLTVFPDHGAPYTAATPSQSPERSEPWSDYLVAHHGSLTGSGPDDLYALSTVSHTLYLVPNDADSGGTAGHFSQPQLAVQIAKPACPTAGGDCTGYDPTWNSTTQIVALDGLGGPGTPPALITVEGTLLYYYPGIGGGQLGTPVLLSNGNWSNTTVLAPGSTGGTPTLWVRENRTGTLTSYPLNLSADGTRTDFLVPPATSQLKSAVRLASGSAMCFARGSDGSAAIDVCGAGGDQLVFGTDGTVQTGGQCLDAASAAAHPSTPLGFLPCDGRASEHHWVAGPGGTLVDSGSNQCVTLVGSVTNNGMDYLSPCTGAQAQTWSTDSVGAAGPLPTPVPISPLNVYQPTPDSGSALVAPGDFTGDGFPDLVELGTDAVLYPGAAAANGAPRFGAPVTLGQVAGYRQSAVIDAADPMRSGDALYSACGWLHLEPNGYLVLTSYTGKQLWSAGTYIDNGQPVASIGDDGDLWITQVNPTGQPLWYSPAAAGAGARATLGDDCNFELRNSAGTPVWSTQTYDPAHDLTGHVVTAGTVLPSGSSLTSNATQLDMQADGNLVLHNLSTGHALWAAGTWNHPGAHAVLQADGNLVVYGADGTALWSTGTWGHPGDHLVVQNDRNVVLYDVNDRALWSTGTANPDTLGQPLASGATLAPDATLASVSGSLRMQTDGNLVLTGLKSGQPLWDSATWSHPGAHATMQADGNLVVYGADGTALWSTGTWGHPGADLVMQNDDNVVLYDADGKALWSTGTYGRS